MQLGSDDSSDGENVDNEEDEVQSKAFEARESQWNRKLSIKQSEEKRVNQLKSSLAISIVQEFEDARNYHLVNPPISREGELTIVNKNSKNEQNLIVPASKSTSALGFGQADRVLEIPLKEE